VSRLTSYFHRRRGLLKLVTRLHTLAYRLSGGAVGGLLFGVPTLLLTSTGRRTGRLTTTPLYWLSDGDAFAVVPSFGGSPVEPDWWKNLQADPRAWVEIGPRRFAVSARATESPVLLAAFIRLFPSYEEYHRSAGRPIPIILLDALPPGPGLPP